MIQDGPGLIAEAHRAGTLSSDARSVFAEMPDIGLELRRGLGAAPTDPSRSVTLVSILVDDSKSITHAGNVQNVCDGHNVVLGFLRTSGAEGVLVHTRYINGAVLNQYAPLHAAVPMTITNYQPDSWTPLYDSTVHVLGTVVAQSQALLQRGHKVRSLTMLISDGVDRGSKHATPGYVRRIVIDMLGTRRHAFAAMGIADGQTDFRAVFAGMGIPDEAIVTAGSAAQLRSMFELLGEKALLAAKSETTFQGLLPPHID